MYISCSIRLAIIARAGMLSGIYTFSGKETITWNNSQTKTNAYKICRHYKNTDEQHYANIHVQC